MKKAIRYIILIAIATFLVTKSQGDSNSSLLYEMVKPDDEMNSSLSSNFFTHKQHNFIKQIVAQEIWQWINNDIIGTKSFNLLKQKFSLDLIKVNASQLFEDYNKNEIKADNIYLEKNLIVTGTIKSIDRGFGEDYYLSLATNDRFSTVRANFKPEYKSTLANLNKRETYVMHCVGDGMLIRSPKLKKCEPGLEFAVNLAAEFMAKFPEILRGLITNIHAYSEDEKKEIIVLIIATNILINLPDECPLLNLNSERNNYDSKNIGETSKLFNQYFNVAHYLDSNTKENFIKDFSNILTKLKIFGLSTDDHEIVKLYDDFEKKRKLKAVK